ncbi:MAG TPA: response regulator [Sphingomonas sp.]|jgi:CheY-like chemotaxis protein
MRHVLIIEDEPLVALDLEQMLADNGATSFDVAMGEEEAVACALDHRPDLITSDVKLLDGCGPRAVERIEEALGPLPVIFVTGTPEDCAPIDVRHEILCKPISPGAFVRAVHRALPD